MGECNYVKNRQNSAPLRNEASGSLYLSQLPATLKGTAQLLRLQVGDVSSLSPPPRCGCAPLVAPRCRGAHRVDIKTRKLKDAVGLWGHTWSYLCVRAEGSGLSLCCQVGVGSRTLTEQSGTLLRQRRQLRPLIPGAFLCLFLGGLRELKMLLYLRLGKYPSPRGCQIFYFFIFSARTW